MPGRFSRNRRIAFLLGNSNYQYASKLRNPANDVRVVGDRLSRLGFIVMGGAAAGSPGIDLTRDQMKSNWNAFVDTVLPGDDIFIYYAGHGLQLGGDNYVVPVDANLNVPNPIPGLTPARVLIEQVARKAGPKGKILVALDACREDPFGREQYERMLRSAAARSEGGAPTDVQLLGKGFASFKLRTADDMAPTFIMFATAPGELALDGSGDHSPFALALTRHMDTRGLELDDLIDRVMDDVRDITSREQHHQIPWNESNLAGDFYFSPKSWRPVLELGGGGFLAGLLICWVIFDGSGKLPPPERIPDIYYLLGLLFAPVIVYGTMRWGSGRWGHAVTAAIVSAVAFMPALWILANSPDAKLGDYQSWVPRLKNLMQHPDLVGVVFLCLLAGMFYSLGTFLGCKFQKSNFLGFSTPAGGIMVGLIVGIGFLIFASLKFWLQRPELDYWLITGIGAVWFSCLGGALGYAFRHYVREYRPMRS